MATQGPLATMALALQARDQAFQQRFAQAMYLTRTDAAAALSEFLWAEQELPQIEKQRSEFDAAMDLARGQSRATMTPEEAAMRNNMATMAHNTWFQIQCGKAQALLLLRRFPEARLVVDNAFQYLTPQTAPEARSMLLQLRATLIAASAGSV